tara:strand:- start:2826 stop:3503 length:678 start_codon:yes stop_codon:yes gene_type:complete
MCDGDLQVLFPRVGSNATLSEPGSVALHALPTALVALAWLLLEAARRRRPFTRAARLQGAVLGMAASGALGVLAWRAFDLLACEGVASAERWRLVAVVGAPLTGAALLLVGRRAPRLSIALALALGAGTVVGEWAARARVSPRAGAPYAAVQHLWLLLAVVLFAHLPGRRRAPIAAARRRTGGTTAAHRAAAPPPPIDALAKRAPEERDAACTTTTPPQAWSWFS